jgi:hypothetical protein
VYYKFHHDGRSEPGKKLLNEGLVSETTSWLNEIARMAVELGEVGMK